MNLEKPSPWTAIPPSSAPPYDDDRGDDSGSAYVFTRSGASWTQQAKLTAMDGAAFDQFGNAISLDGETVLIGARYDDDNGNDSGGAYVFVRSAGVWTQQAKLTAYDGLANDYLGWSVTLYGDKAVIGAPGDDDQGQNGGSAYIFTRSGTTWSESENPQIVGDHYARAVSLDGAGIVVGAEYDDAIRAGNSRINNYWGAAYIFTRTGSSWAFQTKLMVEGTRDFGNSVSVDGDTALIGAVSSDEVYVFVRSGSTWTQQARLSADDILSRYDFGSAVSLDGDTALIGAAGFVDDPGAAYLFVRNGTTWTQQAKLMPSDSAADDNFGHVVSLDGDTALIGATDFGETGNGAGYVFVRNGTSWSQQAKLSPDDGTAGDRFGSDLALSGDTALIGAEYESSVGTRGGAAYVYVRENKAWTRQAKLTPCAAYDHCGCAVSLEGDTALIGAEFDDERATNAGAAYLLTRDGTTWTHRAKMTAADGDYQAQFGVALSLNGDTALIGANYDYTRYYVGSAYVFDIEIIQNSAPIATDNRYVIPQNGTLRGNVINDDDTDPEGDPLLLAAHTEPTNGMLEWIADYKDGNFMYTPYTVFTGEEQYSYTIEDIYNQPSTADVTIFVGDPLPTGFDFDADERADILWRDPANRIFMTSMDGLAKASEGFVTISDWEILALADFNGDFKSDILWRDPANKKIFMSFMNGRVKKTEGFVTISGWDVLGAADFDRDARSDILWHDPSSQKIFMSFMNGTTKKTEGFVTISGWDVLAVADFDGDIKADILWRDPANNKIFMSFMDGRKKRRVRHHLRLGAPLGQRLRCRRQSGHPLARPGNQQPLHEPDGRHRTNRRRVRHHLDVGRLDTQVICYRSGSARPVYLRWPITYSSITPPIVSYA